MLYAKSTGGFYTPEIHGARQIEIFDPMWLRPTTTVTLQPGESYPVGEQVVTNTSDVPTILADVLDVYAVHPTITVDNPDCEIPADAVAISDEQYAALMQGQTEGKRIGSDANGWPILIVPPPLTVPETVVAKKAALAAYRYDKEVGGLTLPNGMRVATDDRSKTLIAGARLDTIDDPTVLTEFKAETGWIQIDAATVTMISTAVAAHVRACFSRERVHSDALDALAEDPATTTVDIEAYDITTGWPE